MLWEQNQAFGWRHQTVLQSTRPVAFPWPTKVTLHTAIRTQGMGVDMGLSP